MDEPRLLSFCLTCFVLGDGLLVLEALLGAGLAQSGNPEALELDVGLEAEALAGAVPDAAEPVLAAGVLTVGPINSA